VPAVVNSYSTADVAIAAGVLDLSSGLGVWGAAGNHFIIFHLKPSRQQLIGDVERIRL
jgi:hypothetical protein